MIFSFSLWSHAKKADLFWDSLRGVHSFGKIFSFIELVLKVLIIVYLFINYRNKNQGQIGTIMAFYIINI